MNKEMKHHGKLIEKALIEKEIGKVQFANMMGITPSNYKYYFGREIIDNKYWEKINKILNIDLSEQPDSNINFEIPPTIVTDVVRDLYERLLKEKDEKSVKIFYNKSQTI
jgi:transcriptional regulator